MLLLGAAGTGGSGHLSASAAQASFRSRDRSGGWVGCMAHQDLAWPPDVTSPLDQHMWEKVL